MYTQSAVAADQARRRRRRTGILAVAVALVLVAAGGLSWWFLTREGTPGHGKQAAAPGPDEIRNTVETAPASPEGRNVIEHYAEHLDDNDEEHPLHTPGTWATDKILARGVADRVEGYKISDTYDETVWTLELGGHICAVSQHVTVDGRTAVVIQPHRKAGAPDASVCDEVVFFDLNTGRKLWQKKMPSADFAYVTNTNLTLTEGVVAVAWGHGSVAYDMKSGRQLWNSTPGSRCEDSGFAGGRALLALEKCGQGNTATYRVQKLDPRTGKPQWTYQAASGVAAVYLPSSEPPVLAVAAGDTMVTDLITLDDQGRHLTTISLHDYDPRCGSRDNGFFGVLEHCEGVVVGRTQAYVTSKHDYSDHGPSNWIVAFDLKTGKTQGKFDGRYLQKVEPLRMSGDELLIYRESAAPLAPGALVSWNPRTDKETLLLLFQLPDDDGYDLSDPEQTDIVAEKGRIFFGPRRLVRNEDSPKDDVLLAVGYGSAGLKH
ncbi:outer membrane protein assembly factor BamB family protein [Streptomyces thermodiastaticus]|uniref:outer membrane protein assembly factor BamB family protein n=1 Tax=Streptomyces thermodiastaticus TaxID=44061 RepID=UPI0019AFEC99|nr:PQQ-binding-like beta-propeller repeat protein [Streptomyces thermodiastaticus]MCE7553206.1 PQQ-like beta-propeller repeat protein [Streptomyces thermodiastaticus]GHF92258.1 hypothetical protein GCM10018787_46340 [Streptomyces thermodiastaticus]